MAEQEMVLMVGTKSGAFVYKSHDGRRTWRTAGPVLDTWEVNHITWDPRHGRMLATTTRDWGEFEQKAFIQVSDDLGETWTQPGDGPKYAEDDPERVNRLWHLTPGPADKPHRIYLGVEASGVFVSEDDGATWTELNALRKHPTHDMWFPGAGGKCMHTVLLDPFNSERMFTACSTGGVYRSEDGGASWEPANMGIRAGFMPEGQQTPPAGQCVHKIDLSPVQEGRMYAQNHGGVYRSDDFGRTWTDISGDLEYNFGFPVVAHPHKADTAFVVPLVSEMEHRFPNGEMAVFRTDDAGKSWKKLRNGLPDGVYVSVLREAFHTDGLEQPGLYLGTSSGSVYVSTDDGESWSLVAQNLPRILSVEAAAVSA